MRDLCEDLNRDLKEKESTISRAAKVIDTLRSEVKFTEISYVISMRIAGESKDKHSRA